MKTAAALIALAVCALVGVRKSCALKKRVDFLNEILLMLKNFSAEIRFRGLTVDELISAEKGRFAQLVMNCRQGGDIKSAWEMACLNLPGNNEETSLLCELGRVLGTSDREGMIDIIALYTEKISALYSRAEADYAKQGKAFVKIGVLCGIGLAVLII